MTNESRLSVQSRSNNRANMNQLLLCVFLAVLPTFFESALYSSRAENLEEFNFLIRELTSEKRSDMFNGIGTATKFYDAAVLLLHYRTVVGENEYVDVYLFARMVYG